MIFEEKDLEEEATKEVREQIKGMIRTMEIFYEELEKSKLPDDVKKAMLLNTKLND